MSVWRGECGRDEDFFHTLECVTADLKEWDAIDTHPAYTHSDVLGWETGQDICHCDCHQDCPWWLTVYAPMIRLYTYKPALEETYD